MKLVNDALLRLMVGAQEFRTRMQEEHGQTLAEYGIILAVVSVIAVGGVLVLFRDAITGAFDKTTSAISEVGS